MEGFKYYAFRSLCMVTKKQNIHYVRAKTILEAKKIHKAVYGWSRYCHMWTETEFKTIWGNFSIANKPEVIGYGVPSEYGNVVRPHKIPKPICMNINE